jgi:hypothetical protein
LLLLDLKEINLTLEAKRKSGFWAISCQAGKMIERKDTQRKPLTPNFPLADVMLAVCALSFFIKQQM